MVWFQPRFRAHRATRLIELPQLQFGEQRDLEGGGDSFIQPLLRVRTHLDNDLIQLDSGDGLAETLGAAPAEDEVQVGVHAADLVGLALQPALGPVDRRVRTPPLRVQEQAERAVPQLRPRRQVVAAAQHRVAARRHDLQHVARHRRVDAQPFLDHRLEEGERLRLGVFDRPRDRRARDLVE